MNINSKIALPFITLLIGIGGYYGFGALKSGPEKKEKVEPEIPVTVEEVVLASTPLTIYSYGESSAKHNATLVAQVSGKIVQIADSFERGKLVKKGELLALIEPLDYEATLAEAKANLASAQAALELEKAQSKVAKDEWEQIHSQPAPALGLRKPQLAQELARVKAAEVGLQRAQNNLERTEIRAPFDAIVSERQISIGSFANVGVALGQVQSIDTAEIRLPVPSGELAYLTNNGLGAEVKLYSGDSQQTTWQGKIIRVENIVDNTSRMVHLVAEIQSPYHMEDLVIDATQPDLAQRQNRPSLPFGTYLTAEIKGNTVKNSTKIPYHILNNNRVAVINDDGRLAFKTVNIVRKASDYLIVTGGLNNADKLITSPLAYPVAGTKVKVINATNDTDQPEDIAAAAEVATDE